MDELTKQIAVQYLEMISALSVVFMLACMIAVFVSKDPNDDA